MVESRFRGRRGALLGAAAIVGAVAGVYVSLAIYGKNHSAVTAECAATPAIASRVSPFAKGEVAAFRVADEPEYLGDIAFTGPTGEPMSLADFAGRTILVNLWATWCVPCRVEMPALDDLEATLSGDDFEVVAINIDRGDAERPRAFLDEISVENLEFFSDPTSAVFTGLKRRGLAFGLPVTLLIDGAGCRIGSVDGPAEWNSDDARALVNAARGHS